MKFKGTKGEWKSHQNTTGDIEISAREFNILAIVNFYPKDFREKHINGKPTGSPSPDSTQYRKECLYNAKLISKAPDILEKLNEILHYEGGEERLPSWEFEEIKELIKQATTI